MGILRKERAFQVTLTGQKRIALFETANQRLERRNQGRTLGRDEFAFGRELGSCQGVPPLGDLAAPCLPARKPRGTKRLPKDAGKPSRRRALKIKLATAEVPLATDKLNFLLELRIANANRARYLAFHRARHNPIAKQLIYVQFGTGLEANPFSISGHGSPFPIAAGLASRAAETPTGRRTSRASGASGCKARQRAVLAVRPRHRLARCVR